MCSSNAATTSRAKISFARRRTFSPPSTKRSMYGSAAIEFLRTRKCQLCRDLEISPQAGHDRIPRPPRYDPKIPRERHASHDNCGPEGQFRCFRHPPHMTKPPARGNRARKVNQTRPRCSVTEAYVLLGDFVTARELL